MDAKIERALKLGLESIEHHAHDWNPGVTDEERDEFYAIYDEFFDDRQREQLECALPGCCIRFDKGSNKHEPYCCKIHVKTHAKRREKWKRENEERRTQN